MATDSNFVNDAVKKHAISNAAFEQLLLRAIAGDVSTSDRQQLAASLCTAQWQVAAFDITAETVSAVIDQRIQRLQTVYPVLKKFCQTLGWQDCPVSLLWQLWLPLAEQIALWQKLLNRPLVQGILGVQGTGKTTLSLILAEILNSLSLQVCRFSIDDLYKTYAERQQLQQSDPRLRWRGPPGTHDVQLGLTVLHQLKANSQEPVAIPRFDKSAHNGAGDRTEPDWITGADIVLFEGWFVGVRPIDPQKFDAAPPPIETTADRDFARETNARLQAYLPLWEELDRLIVLSPSDYRLSQQWRRQAEQQMKATGQSGMSDTEINQFVEYFWRALHPELFIKPLLQDSQHVDLVIEIDANHQPSSVYRPDCSHGIA